MRNTVSLDNKYIIELIHNFIKLYQLAGFFKRLVTFRQYCKHVLSHFYRLLRKRTNNSTLLTNDNERQNNCRKLKFGYKL